ncbi:WbqC family protein [Sulfuricurvum sp.]|uniref:WbqC family protein n=1 Tax=Sulfuricurvum sp. TaxID=2025608 RepID=UPI00260FFC1A|nr:WbqC family protein [Sulfuricurvum sp.]MDD2780467.1 WbqC family protein [Sulfuricurvum sp.]
MTLGIMQPYLFPYIGYWQLIEAVDTFIIYDDVSYIKQGWINRNQILFNSKRYLFTLELQGASSFKKINEVEVGNNRIKLLKTFEQAYRKAPFFNDVFPMLTNIMTNQELNLARYLEYSIKEIVSYLNLQTKIIISTQIEKDTSLKGQDKIINICKKLNATHYINTIGGQVLYDKESFTKRDISLSFIKTNLMEYRQFSDEFISHLSIIDVMMFNNINDIKNMMQEYELV